MLSVSIVDLEKILRGMFVQPTNSSSFDILVRAERSLYLILNKHNGILETRSNEQLHSHLTSAFRILPQTLRTAQMGGYKYGYQEGHDEG